MGDITIHNTGLVATPVFPNMIVREVAHLLRTHKLPYKKYKHELYTTVGDALIVDPHSAIILAINSSLLLTKLSCEYLITVNSSVDIRDLNVENSAYLHGSRLSSNHVFISRGFVDMTQVKVEHFESDRTVICHLKSTTASQDHWEAYRAKYNKEQLADQLAELAVLATQNNEFQSLLISNYISMRYFQTLYRDLKVSKVPTQSQLTKDELTKLHKLPNAILVDMINRCFEKLGKSCEIAKQSKYLVQQVRDLTGLHPELVPLVRQLLHDA